MNKNNWPFFTNLGDSNWTGRTDRTMRDNAQYSAADKQIPLIAYVIGAVGLFVVFGYVPLLWVLTR